MADIETPQDKNARDAALAALKRQISTQRARIDPRVLKIAERAARLHQEQEGKENELVPYDRESAAQAVSLFLHNSPHPEKTRQYLLSLLTKSRRD